MQRCLELAAIGVGKVFPNPVVGAVLVHGDRIIGEGYHAVYGQAHAEVNCFDSVAESDRALIAESTLYVSLEPCAHYGKTPPCADRIIRERIPRVVIGALDPFPLVDGKGLSKLQKAGIETITGILEDQCRELNKRFYCFHTKHRPYITLKWAETGDRYIANDDYSRLFISNKYTQQLVHRWRSEEASILVGTNTALFDDPQLTNREWTGRNPVRLIIDTTLRLPSSLKVFDGSVPAIIFNYLRHEEEGAVQYYQVGQDADLIDQVMNALVQKQVVSVLVEGGTKLLQSFIDKDLWDEARVISNKSMRVGAGLKAPELANAQLVDTMHIEGDELNYYRRRTTATDQKRI